MTWKVKDIVAQRIELIFRVINGGESIAKLSDEFGISRTTAHTWLRRYRESGSVAALEDRSRAPRRVANRTPEAVQKRVLELRQQERWAGRKIQEVLRREGIRIGARTIDRILDRAGCIDTLQRQKPAPNRFERSHPNELWQMDFKGQYRSANGDCYPLSILDDHSRFAVGLYALKGVYWEPVRDCLIETFQTYGVPEQMLMDHGTPWWGTTSERGLSQLSVMLIKQGIRLSYSGIGHPQTQGKVERFHRTLSEAMIHQGVPQTMADWQPRLDRFRQTYNQVRPHEALAMQVPQQRYQTSPRGWCANPPAWQYPAEWTPKLVNSEGSIFVQGGRFFISRALAKETVAIRKLENVLIVRYRQMYVRELDLKTGRTQELMAETGDEEGHAN